MDLHPEVAQVLNFWFPSGIHSSKYEGFWFNATAELDHQIEVQFGALFRQAEQDQLPHFKLTKEGQLALIILLDQFTRNLSRLYPLDRTRNDAQARSIAYDLISKDIDLNLSMNQRYFVLLPFRHHRTMESLQLVFTQIHKYESQGFRPSDKDLFDRMKKASQKEINRLEDTRVIYNPTDQEGKLEEIQHIILSNRGIIDEKLYQTELKLTRQGPIDYNDELNLFTPLVTAVRNNLNDSHHDRVAVSLSGGVDSMVLLAILQGLRSKLHISQVYAIHLNYGNRSESLKEELVLRHFCQQLKITLIVKTIYEMKRTGGSSEEPKSSEESKSSEDRNFYEQETRKFRFELYRWAMNTYQITGIGLGHHRGDVAENTLSNLLHGRNLLDLSVMSTTTTLDGVVLLRPMLSQWKDIIYKYAYHFGIPFFKDSTPKWSNRGRLRNEIFPRLEQTYGSGLYRNLVQASESSEEWNQVVQNFVLKPIYQKLVFLPLGCHFELNLIVGLPRSLLDLVFLNIFHKMKHSMITSHGMTDLINYLNRQRKADPDRTTYVKLSNKMYITVDQVSKTFGTSRVYLFDSQIFHLENHFINPASTGYWKLTSTPVYNVQALGHITYEDIMSGFYFYTTKTSVKESPERVKSWIKNHPTRTIFNHIQGVLRDYIPMIGCNPNPNSNLGKDNQTWLIELRFVIR